MNRLLAGATFALMSCSLGGVEPEPAAATADVQRIHIATRAPLGAPGATNGAPRRNPVQYEVVDVTVPSTHRPGRVERPNRARSDRGFRLSNYRVFESASAFLADVGTPWESDDDVTLVFVHGYNTSTAKAVMRFAQIKSDFRQTAPSVVFAWPSAGDPSAYAYDRDSVLFARDDLVSMLGLMSRNSDRDIAIIAHSMGSLLTMEALRQIAISGRRDLLRRIVWVALVSPDIDADVFRTQSKAIDPWPREFYILTTGPDRALRLSSFLAGGGGRVGTIRDARQVEGLDVTVLDLSAFAGVGLNHGVGFRSPGAIAGLIGLNDGTPPPTDGRAELLAVGDTTHAASGENER